MLRISKSKGENAKVDSYEGYRSVFLTYALEIIY